MWVGIDDTDSPRGGCTTFVLTEVIRAAQAAGFDLVGEPRLVRLNPNIPYKTRGNAALAARFGHGRGRRRKVGAWKDEPVWSFEGGRPLAPTERETLVDRAWEAVLRNSEVGAPGTDPVLVASPRALPSELYRAAVSRLVDPGPLERRLRDLGATVRATGDRGGVVGASSAIAWPGRRATWELLSYRERRRWGSRRTISAESVRVAETRFPTLFLCHDDRTRRLMVAPHTACPILFGLRSTRRTALPGAAALVWAEPVERWLEFRTNQATGDHLVRRWASDLRSYDSAWFPARVRGVPEVLRGGHVRLDVVDLHGTRVRCVAFEPTKTLPRAAALLRDGDRVDVWGGLGADPTFRLEGFRVVHLVADSGPVKPPRCPTCGRSARSLGRTRGYRCPGCRRRFPPERAEGRPRPASLAGEFHPTPSARRHLHPLPGVFRAGPLVPTGSVTA